MIRPVVLDLSGMRRSTYRTKFRPCQSCALEESDQVFVNSVVREQRVSLKSQFRAQVLWARYKAEKYQSKNGSTRQSLNTRFSRISPEPRNRAWSIDLGAPETSVESPRVTVERPRPPRRRQHSNPVEVTISNHTSGFTRRLLRIAHYSA